MRGEFCHVVLYAHTVAVVHQITAIQVTREVQIEDEETLHHKPNKLFAIIDGTDVPFLLTWCDALMPSYPSMMAD